jgi:predicted nucleotidyltransferase
VKVRIYNDTLEPNLWNENMTLKPEISQALLKIASDFIESTKIGIQISDVYMLGSCANYNWTPTSDIDLHVVIDKTKLQIPQDEKGGILLKALSFKWNTEHDVKIKGHNVETYIQDINEKNHATGVYSLHRNCWILKPVKQKIILDKPLIKSKYEETTKRVKEAIKTKDVDKLKTVMKDIMDMRNAGLDRAGEFSTENIVFKVMRSRGIIKDLKDAINTNYDKLLSVKQEGFGGDPNTDKAYVKGDRWTVQWR